MRRSLSLAVYLLWARLRGGVSRQTPLQTAPPPAQGPVIWAHIANITDSPPVIEVLRRLLADNPGALCLLTTADKPLPAPVLARLPERVVTGGLPLDTPQAGDAFLDAWKPDLAIWSDFILRPALLDRTKRRGIALVLINARLSVIAFRRWRFLRGMVGSLLGRFDRVLVQDAASSGYFRALGVARERILVTGKLTEGSAPLDHDEAERRSLSAAIGGRTVWLAAGIDRAELPAVLAAHHHARRRFPDLLLIITADSPANAAEMAETCRTQGYKTARHSARDSISKRTDIFIGDTPAGRGLWYRLAPVAFLGGSLVKGGGANPFEAAALGSAILHGPHVGAFRTPYRKLTAAGACVEVTDSATLARALEQTLVPERAAEMATAAWGVGSEGAEVTDMVLDVLQDTLEGAAK